MSTEGGKGKHGKTAEQAQRHPTESSIPASQGDPTTPIRSTHPKHSETLDLPESERKPPAKRDQASESTSPSTPDDPSKPRQVIAVSASKGPAAFFNLARKFLVTDEMCDLSALEGAIVSAVDAAHLLERSQLATIVRVQTSYVSVEPKRRKSHPQAGPSVSPVAEGVASMPHPTDPSSQPFSVSGRGRPTAAAGRELRRARIVITVKRTESYKKWLEENPLQAIIAGDGGDDEEEVVDEATSPEDIQRR